MADDLVGRLRIKADMIHLGETIAWGSDVALMHEAVARITELEARLAVAEAGEDALAELLMPMADENPLPTCGCLGCRVAAALAAYDARRKG